MGCGQSHFPVYSSKKRNLRENENGTLLVETPEKKLIGDAISSAGWTAVNVSESARELPPPKERGSFSLEGEEFIDGLLGTTNESSVREKLAMISPDEKYVDSEFPPSTQSLYFVERRNDDIEWKRPQELVDRPKLFVAGVNRRDVVQGILGNCWFLSSCAAVAKMQKLIERVIPPNQSLYGKNYKGLIVCQFWRFGEWVTVSIDDFLPTQKGKLIYAKSENPNEFWVALLEKAYAKLHGSYQALEGGQSMDALVDLTGGIAERYDMDQSPDRKELFNHISKATRNGAFITASRKGDWRHAFKTDENGLVEGHAYSVSGVAKVDHSKKGTVDIIRMRNPWGNEAEWSGAWSDGDEMWDFVSAEIRRKLLTDDRKDGEFWMSIDDFYREFEEISLCTMGPDFDSDGIVDKAGMVLAIKGEWKVGKNAGGSRNDFKKFATNPQFALTIKGVANKGGDNADEANHDHGDAKGRSAVLIGLLQEHRRSRKDRAVTMNQIGFCVYKAKRPNERIPLSDFLYMYDEGTSGTYINYREVISRLDLSPGSYVLVPATFDPDTPGSFMVRVYSPDSFELNSLDER